MSAGDDEKPGPWMPCQDFGYNAHRRPWVLERVRPRVQGWTEVLYGANFNLRRWATRDAAQRVADQLNGSKS